MHGPNFLEPPPDIVDGNEEWEVGEILAERKHGAHKKNQFRVCWKGWSAAHDSWEPEENVHAPELIAQFHSRQTKHKKDRDSQPGPLLHLHNISMDQEQPPTLPILSHQESLESLNSEQY